MITIIFFVGLCICIGLIFDLFINENPVVTLFSISIMVLNGLLLGLLIAWIIPASTTTNIVSYDVDMKNKTSIIYNTQNEYCIISMLDKDSTLITLIIETSNVEFNYSDENIIQVHVNTPDKTSIINLFTLSSTVIDKVVIKARSLELNENINVYTQDKFENHLKLIYLN